MSQKSLAQAHQQGFLELSNWANLIINRIRMNYDIQKIWPQGNPGPYKYYWIINAARHGSHKSTGKSFAKQNLYATVANAASGDTTRIDFFFREYLLFVDYGVGKGQKFQEVPDMGVPQMRKRYANWSHVGDRQRRPVVIGSITGSRFFLGKLIQDYWNKEVELAITLGLSEKQSDNSIISLIPPP